MTSLASRILHGLGLGRVTVVDDTGVIQRIQVDQGPSGPDGARRVIDKVPFVGQFGLTSHPPVKSDVTIIRLAGNRTLGIAIGSNHQPSRLKNLKEGDAALYDVRGAFIWLTESGLVIDGAGLPMTIRNIGTLAVEGDLHVTGDVVSRSGGSPVSLNGLRDAYHAHKHPGVQTGSGSTSTTDHDA